jgi:hypothetical protein
MLNNLLKFLTVIFLLAIFTGFSYAQVTTNSGSGLDATYTSLADAITALNAATITDPVVITLTGDETAPVGGYAITQLGGTSTNTITIQGSSSTITAYTPQATGSASDAIFKIIGGDYITIQNFTMQENTGNTVVTPVTSNTMTEFGVLLVHVSATDGCQYNTIQNNNISLNSTYQNSVGIFSTSSSLIANLATGVEATSTAGTNSNNKVYANTINNVAYGIWFINPPITATVFESGNDIGGSSISTGNTITFGNPTASSGTTIWFRATSTIQAGITMRNGYANNIRFNNITSNSAAYVGSGGLNGILLGLNNAPVGVTYTTTISDNTISLTTTGVALVYGIDFGGGISTGTIVANNNNITINQNTSAAASTALIGIKANYTSATNTLNNNTITVNQTPNTTGALTSPVTGINAAGAGTTVNVNNNLITFNQAAPGGTATYGSGAITYIDVSAASGTVNVNSNQLLTTGSTIRSTGALVGVSHTSGTISVGLTINLNTINIDRVAASGTITGTNETTSPSTVSHTITNNGITFTNLSGTTAANGIATLGGVSATGTVKAVNGNTINISGTHSGTSIGIQVGYSYGNMNNNSVTISSAGATVVGLQATSTSAGAYTITGNTLSLTSSATSPTSMIGINTGATGPYQIYTNTFSALNYTGIITASPIVSAIVCAAGTGNNIYNNVITNISVGAATSTGSPIIDGILISGGTATNVYKNKIYGLITNAAGTSTTVNGIRISGGTTNTVFNNLIGELNSPASASVDGIRGISVNSSTTSSTNNIYFNNIYLNAASTGTNFGTSGIYHLTNATATTGALNLRNNVIVNNSTSNGTGLTVAFRRSSSTLTNYASTSNNNDLYAANILYDGTSAYTTMPSYKTLVAPRDAASFSENPTFVSTAGSNQNFLHLDTTLPTQIESGGQPIAGITDDFDGELRNASTPDVGADEFTGVGIDLNPPVITYTPLLNTGSTGNRTLNASIVDASGVPTAGLGLPVLYWKIGALGTYTGATGSYVSGNDYSFSFGSGVVATDTVFYFVAAQDVNGNITVFPLAGASDFTPDPPTAGTPPTSPSSYVITAVSLAGDYTVGTALFNSITGRNIYFEKSINKVRKEVWVPNPQIESKEGKVSDSPVLYGDYDKSRGSFQMMEVEEVVWTPMENGLPVTGDLFVKKSENPQLNFAEGIEGIYVTLTAAIADLNVRGVDGNVNFLLTDALYSTETLPIVVNITNENKPTSTKKVTIKPNTGVTATITGTSASGVFVSFGVDYIVIDGSNAGGTDRSLTIENTSTAANTYVLGIFNNGVKGAQYNSIINCNVKAGSNSVTTFGIILNFAGGDYDNTTIQNNNILKANVGMQFTGVTTGITNGGSISKNIFGSDTDAESIGNIGLLLSYVDGLTVSENIFKNIKVGTNPKGVVVSTSTVNSTIDKNLITGIVYTGTGGYGGKGIDISTGSATSNLTLSNNILNNITGDGWSALSGDGIVGIRILGTTGGINLYHNSINLSGTANRSTATNSAAIYIPGNTGFDLRNNIFVNSIVNNTTVTSKSYAIYNAGANTAFTEIDYNDYFAGGTQGVLGYQGADQTTLTAWQTATGKDLNSVSGDPKFVSPTDLHIVTSEISPVSNAGFYLASVPTDFDGDLRNNPPDIGADEYTYVEPSVIDPTNFAAVTASGSQINLSWTKNVDDNNVMIAVNSTNTFGVPVNSTAYNVSDPIAGGGTIIYTGPASGFNHTGLNANSQYFYRAWSYNAGNIYSPGVNANATTSVVNPTAVTATPFSASQINLAWTKNANDDNVMVVTNSVNTFGVPVNGTAYEVNDPVTGGGTVIYNGPASLFDHTGLITATTYYYKVFSAEVATNYYSSGVSVNATTLCDLAALPFAESFDAVTFPPNCWTRINAGSGNNWARTTTGMYLGAGAMRYTYNTSFAANTWMITPGFNLQAGTSYIVKFYQKVESATFPERLKVTVGDAPTVAGQTTTIWDNAGGTNLANTSYILRTAEYTPAATGTYYFGFNCYSIADQYYLYVDEILIDEAPTTDIGVVALTEAAGTLLKESIVPTGLSRETSNKVEEADAKKQYNLSLSIIPQESGNYTEAGPVNFKVAVKNFGAAIQNSYQVGWNIDGNVQTAVNNTLPLAGGATDTLTLTWAAPIVGLHTIRGWTILAGDINTSNDSSSVYSFYVAPDNSVFLERFNGSIPPANWDTLNVDGGGLTAPWFAGNPTVFPALEGSGYIGSNYNGANGLYIDQWLITPNTGGLLESTNNDSLVFWMRSPTGSLYPDSVQIRVSTTGKNVEDFTTLLQYIQAPTNWTRFAYPLPNASNRYIAFRYLHYDGGAAGSNSNYIGLDLVEIQRYIIPPPAQPQTLAATTVSSSQIDVAFTQNANNDNVIIIWNNTGIFTTPTGLPAAVGEPFAGGIVLYYGGTSPVNHTGLTASTQYFYKAFSYNNVEYSLGITANATTSASVPTTFQLSVSVNNGWNMVSTPGLHPTNQDVTTWWSGKDPAAGVFKFNGGYVSVTNTVPGEGYWMKNLGANTYNTGDEWPAGGIQIVPNIPITGATGWNLIGGYELSVLTANITTEPTGLQTGQVFGYSGGYTPATNLLPGYAYWIKLTAPGSINIPTSLAKSLAKTEVNTSDWGKIIITDNSGISYTLYVVNGKVNLNDYELPPAPPAGMFDVRYESNRYAEELNGIQSILMNGLEYPVKVYVENIDLRLQDETGSIINTNVRSGQDVTITNSSVSKIMVSTSVIPDKYSLEQNYPNPFNPSTIISFAIPEAGSNVRLIIYDALGQKVAELVNEKLDAGNYQYQWNASNMSTGLYFYELQTDKFVSVKKMILMK